MSITITCEKELISVTGSINFFQNQPFYVQGSDSP